MKRVRGLALSEILMALAIFALIALVVLLIFGGGLHHLLGTRTRSVALGLAEEKMEEWLARPQTQLQSESGQFTGTFAAYRWKVDMHPLDNGVACLTVTVSGSESATLTAYHRASPGVIVYACPTGSGEAIFQCRPDGTGVQQLTDGTTRDTGPALSPDGKRIAFASNRQGFMQLYLFDLATKNVTTLASHLMGASSPSWSPDGAMVAYVATDHGHSQIFITSALGGGSTNLSRSNTHETSPCWSPDGSHLCWVTDRYGGMDLVVADRNGGEQHRLTDNGPNWAPAWSPDGRWIAFISNYQGSSRVFLIDSEGHDRHVLTEAGTGGDDQVSWSPDGLQVIFDRQTRLGESALNVINRDGSGLHPLAGITLAHAPSWVR